MRCPDQHNRRVHDRLRIPPMYTAVTARRVGRGLRRVLRGHLYDISASGARIELDEALKPGDRVSVDLELPGTEAGVRVLGSVVWVTDDADDPGPRRMALRFTRFADRSARERLLSYLACGSLRRAA